MVDDSLPFPHLSNILHQLGHELHSELTEDICRRDAARRFENKLEMPINRAKLEKVGSTGAPKFPYYSKLAPQCGDCALITSKKPIERLRGPPQLPSLPRPVSRSSSKIQIVRRRKLSVTNHHKFRHYPHPHNNGDGRQQREHKQPPKQKQQQRRQRNQKVPKMCDSSTQTDENLLPPPVDNKSGKKEEKNNEKIDSTKNETAVAVGGNGGDARIDGDQIDESFTVTETSSDPLFGKYERKLDGKRHWKHQKLGSNQAPKKFVEEKSVKIVEAPKVEVPKNEEPKEIIKEKKPPPPQKRRVRKCSIPAAEDAIPFLPREQQLYAPIELHCAAESAVKAVDRTVNALEKLVLLAPKNSIEQSLMKTISLMCVFLRQFHTELKTRKDRRSKLEIILKLWTELQKQSTQGNAIKIPSEVYQQQPSETNVTVAKQHSPSTPVSTTATSDDITVKTVSPTTTSGSSLLNVFETKKQQQQQISK